VARAAVEAVDGIGITAVELFELADGRILINELAPRPHNTGHYTIEGCYTLSSKTTCAPCSTGRWARPNCGSPWRSW